MQGSEHDLIPIGFILPCWPFKIRQSIADLPGDVLAFKVIR